MSSSRSITAARSRRAGEQVPPISGTRPGTSIGSHAAFAPQPQYQQQQPSPNVRVARGQPPPQQQQQQPTQMQQPSNGLPFTKLSISDAIGLITLRLGRVEQFIIDVENGEQSVGGLTQGSIPENSKIVDISVLNNIVSRIDSLEKREINTNNSEQLATINDEVAGIRVQVNKLNEEFIKNNLLLSNHTEQIFRFNRTLTETKDLLQSLTLKVDGHIQETTEKFGDFEYAITEVEKSIPIIATLNGFNHENIGFTFQEEHLEKEQEQRERDEQEQLEKEQQDNSAILSVDLKNIIKQELANV
jgi:HSP20 family molecular chaperone IbpA